MMETYGVSCKKNTANENSSGRKTNQNRIILLSVCDKNKLSFLKNQELHNFNNI